MSKKPTPEEQAAIDRANVARELAASQSLADQGLGRDKASEEALAAAQAQQQVDEEARAKKAEKKKGD